MEEKQKILFKTLFSVDQLNQIGNNEEEFTNTMLSKFTKIATDCSNDLQSALSKSDWSKIKSICHKNIFSYAILDLNEIVILLKFVEKNAEEDPESIINAINIIYKKNIEVVEAINEYLKLIALEKQN